MTQQLESKEIYILDLIDINNSASYILYKLTWNICDYMLSHKPTINKFLRKVIGRCYKHNTIYKSVFLKYKKMSMGQNHGRNLQSINENKLKQKIEKLRTSFYFKEVVFFERRYILKNKN